MSISGTRVTMRKRGIGRAHTPTNTRGATTGTDELGEYYPITRTHRTRGGVTAIFGAKHVLGICPTHERIAAAPASRSIRHGDGRQAIEA
jgi:hypothetical protein